MTTQRIHLLIFVLGVTTLLVQSIVLHWRGSIPPGGTASSASEPELGESEVPSGAGKPSDSRGQQANAGADYVPMAPVQRWRVLTRSPAFQLIESGSLELKEVVAELLGLTPGQTKELQGAFSTLLDEVRAEEVKRAYVRVKGNGSEEVVVAPFDRGPLLQKFRESVAAKLGGDIGDFCAQEALYDETLAVGNKEVRIYTERGMRIPEGWSESQTRRFAEVAERMGGSERLKISRGVHRRNRTGKPEWEGEAAPPQVSTLSNSAGYGARYRHLQEAISRLPKKREPTQ